jgi:hypothetical protein
MTISGCGGIEQKSFPVVAKPQPDSRESSPAMTIMGDERISGPASQMM